MQLNPLDYTAPIELIERELMEREFGISTNKALAFVMPESMFGTDIFDGASIRVYEDIITEVQYAF